MKIKLYKIIFENYLIFGQNFQYGTMQKWDFYKLIELKKAFESLIYSEPNYLKMILNDIVFQYNVFRNVDIKITLEVKK